VFLPVPGRNQHRRATVRRSRSRSQVVVAHRWWSLRERDVRLPVRGLSQMVPTARSKRPETDEEGDRSEPGSVGANAKDRRSDKQRSFRSRRGATVLHARRPPRDVRMSRMLSISEARINSSNAFVLEPYQKRLKTLCRMHVGVSTRPSRVRRIQARVAHLLLRQSSMSVLAQDVLPLQNIVHHSSSSGL